jgi:hypothetical protein
MFPVNLIGQAIKDLPDCPELPCDPVIGICTVTGIETECVPAKTVFGTSFTNTDILARPDSAFISVGAFRALKYRPERSAWFCSWQDGFESLTRIAIREKVFQPNMPDIWAAYATTSYKKHGSLKTKINTGNKRVWLFEEKFVDCTDMQKVNEWWKVMIQAQQDSISRPIIESLQCAPYIIKIIGLPVWMKFYDWAQDKYKSSLYQFLCYLLPSQEELKRDNDK